MGKVHPLLTQQFEELLETQRDGETSKEKPMEEASTASENEMAANSDSVGEHTQAKDPALKPADISADLVMGDIAEESAAVVLPSQLDPLSSNEEGPPSRLDFQALTARLVLVENWILRHGSKI